VRCAQAEQLRTTHGVLDRQMGAGECRHSD
jgi:hypothetical protein